MANTTLPLILCGPILRRTDAQNVCIWIALSKPVQKVKTRIYSYDQPDHPLGESEQTTLQFGANLHLALIQVQPAEAAFPMDHLLCYDVSLDGVRIVDTAVGPSIAYAPLRLPSFFIQSKDTPLNLLFGSCRKIHGPDFDCLSRADDVLTTHTEDISKRPSALFMGGDQIYADDVSSVVMPMIIELSQKIIGNEGRSGETSDKPYSFGARGYMMKSIGLQHLGSYADNHLMKFGEFVAMYCLAWNPDVWSDDFAFRARKELGDLEYFICEGEDAQSEEVQDRVKRHEKEIKLVEQFRLRLSSVRRVLANIPTYMIFDDHEITDDWNISQAWKELVNEHPVGMQVLSNGLTAYWLFQAWGNDPSNFNQAFVKRAIEYTQAITGPDQLSTYDYQVYYGIKSIGTTWDFITPTYPQALFLDTRTKRYFEFFSDKEFFPLETIKDIIAEKTNKAIDFVVRFMNAREEKKYQEEIRRNPQKFAKQLPARLIKDEHFKTLKNRFGTALQNEAFFLVTATPVFGLQRFEDTLRAGSLWLKTEEYDVETWAANYYGYLSLLKFLIDDTQASNCIILSGDVHYGFVNQCSIKIAGAPEATTFTQITSSSLKNNPKGNLKPPIVSSILSLVTELEENMESHKVHNSIEWTEDRRYFPIKGQDDKKQKIIADNNLGLLKFENNVLNYQFLYLEQEKDSGTITTGSSKVLQIEL